MTIPFFDATTVAPSTGAPEPLPVNTYAVQLTKIEKVLKKGDDSGKQWGLAAEFTVVEDGQYKGRKIFEQYNMANANADTVRIAYEQFSSLCHVVGNLKPRTPEELVSANKVFKLKLRIEPEKNGYPAKNRIAAYLYADGTKIGGQPGVAGAPAAAAKPANGVPSWAQKAS